MSESELVPAITSESLAALNGVARKTVEELFRPTDDIEKVGRVHAALERLASARAQEVDAQRDLLRSEPSLRAVRRV